MSDGTIEGATFCSVLIDTDCFVVSVHFYSSVSIKGSTLCLYFVFFHVFQCFSVCCAESTSDIHDTRWFCCVLDSETVLKSQPCHPIPAACDGMGVAARPR